MFKKINLMLILIIFLISLSAISAEENNETLETPSPHIITADNYNDYFNNQSGELISDSVNEGDTINLEGNFTNVNFAFKKAINLNGTATLRDCTINIYSQASGSTISNLKIFNTLEYKYGIFLNGATNCLIKGCFINNTGASAYPICIGNGANYNNVTDNNLHTYGITYGHGTRSTPPLLLCGSHYNYIAGNNISCDDANAIYLSSYSGGPLKGGNSNFNIIYNNMINYKVLPTSWSYGIQIMGKNNTVDHNTVVGAFRGICVSGEDNIISNNCVINITGADYNNLNVEVGGEYAIVGSTYTKIINNTVKNAKITQAFSAISALDYSLIENNTVEVISSGVGIHPQASNIKIKNNSISTISGSGVLFNTYSNNLTVDSNRIISQNGVGVLIQKVSSKRRPNDLTIINNYIETTNTYSIDARDADKSQPYVIENNYGPSWSGKIATPEGEYKPSEVLYNFKGNKYTITPLNYDTYINSNGAFISNITDGDIISFEGEFSNRIIFVNAAVKITGNNPKFYNTTFRLTSNGIWIENITITNQKASLLNAWGVLIYKISGAKVINCTINVEDPNAAYAIYVVESSDVDIINNKLYSSGNLLTYTLLAHTVEDCKFINNTIVTNGTGVVHTFEGSHCIDGNDNCLDGDTLVIGENCIDGSCLDGNCLDGNHVVQEVYRTYGILMLYSSNNLVSGNNVTVTSKLNQSISTYNSTNSIVGIDLYYNSHNNIFSQNNVYVYASDNYIYGMGVLGFYTGHNAPEGQGATNNQFINNNITVCGKYCAEGLIIGGGSYNTTITSNKVNVKAESVIYGINLETSNNSTIKNNNFTLDSDAIYGIQAYQSSNNIVNNNNVEINSKQSFGMVLSNSVKNNIVDNTFVINGTGEDISFKNFDSIFIKNAGIYLMYNSTNNLISNNSITSKKGYAILIDDDAISNTIINNYLDSEFGTGNNAVNNTFNNTVKYNYKYLVNGTLFNVDINYLENGTFIFKTDDVNLNNARIDFIDVFDNIINSTYIVGGEASFTYDFKDYTPASYQFSAIVYQENYKLTQFYCMVNIDVGYLSIKAINVTGIIAKNTNFTAIVKNIHGAGVDGIKVEFYVIDDGFNVYIGEAVSDNEGVANLYTEMPKIYGDNPTVIANISNPIYFKSNYNTTTLTAYSLVETSIEVNKNVYPQGILAILKDSKGNPLPDKKIELTLGSIAYSLTTNSRGEVAMPVVFKGFYSFSIIFEGDNDYYGSQNKGLVNVLPSLSENSDSSVYYGNTVEYKVRVKDSAGGYSAGCIVLIKVNGQTYHVATDGNGYAYQNIKLKVGTYEITAEYNGDSVLNTLVFKSVLTAKNIVKKKAKTIKFSVKLVNKYGKALKNKKVTFKIKGKSYKIKTNKKGVATVSIKNLKKGKYTITSSYNGCTIKNTIKIKK